MVLYIKKTIYIILLLLLPTPIFAKDIYIITTLKPIASLIANIIDDNDSVTNMIDKNYSPHHFLLKPSHIQKLYKSDAVILINPEFETFMQSSFKIIPTTSKVITLSNAPDLTLYSNPYISRHHKHKIDYHIWLSIPNMIKIVTYLQEQLSIINPKKQKTYVKNADITIQKLTELHKILQKKLHPITQKPFMVFHNGLQYFIKDYHLNFVGTVTDNPVAYNSVRKIQTVQKQLVDTKVICIFQEPQFSDKMIKTLIKNTPTKIGTLDYLGSNIKCGKNHYFHMMQSLSKNMIQCLNDK